MTRRSEARIPGEVLVAIDVGTSGARAAAFDLAGERVLEARRAYGSTAPETGWSEQDPREWVAAAIGSLGDLVRRLGGSRVLGIGLTGQCPTICLVDASGVPTSPGLMYRDNRADAEAVAIRARFGDAAIHRRTGHLPAAFHIAPKLQWIRDRRPDWLRDARWALQPRDLVALALTGEVATDGSHAAATLAFDLRRRAWDEALIEDLGLPLHIFPPIRAPWEPLGTLRPAVARRVRLPATTRVVLGGADSQACALGAAVVGPGPVSEMAGSSTCLNAASPTPLDVLLVTNYPHVVPDLYTTETGINTTGTAVSWIADLLYGGRRGRAGASDFAALDEEVARVTAAADGVVAIPVLGDGERTDPRLRAAVAGLSLRHGRATLARAMLEGVAFTIRGQLDLLVAGGAPPTELRVSGGDARLRTWNAIKADVTGLSVAVIPGDAAATGVAMLAGIGVGVYADVDDAVRRCVRIEERFEPNPDSTAMYAAAYDSFRQLEMAEAIRRPAGLLPAD